METSAEGLFAATPQAGVRQNRLLVPRRREIGSDIQGYISPPLCSFLSGLPLRDTYRPLSARCCRGRVAILTRQRFRLPRFQLLIAPFLPRDLRAYNFSTRPSTIELPSRETRGEG